MVNKNKENGRFQKRIIGEFFENFAIYYDKKGYPIIWIDNKNVKLHVYVWERVNGTKPKNMQIHHLDNNKKNFKLENLILISQSEHFKIHAGWIKNNGDWLKPCKDCKKLLPLNKFYQRKGLTPSNRCIECSLLMCKEISKNENFKFKRKKYMNSYYKKNKNKWDIYENNKNA